jgi:osmotically-inducible protein OsmY
MMAAGARTDEKIRQAVLEEFAWTPEIQRTDIGVAANDGVVTLTGTVDSYMKWMMERSAFRVAGLAGVINYIVVRPIKILTDADIAQAVERAVAGDPEVPAGSIQVSVDKGVVTLTGEVDWQFQRAAAESDARRVTAVHNVINQVTVKPRAATAEAIRTGIGQALIRSAEVEAVNIQVFVDGGHVTLKGTARSWAERQEAENAAWRAPGVTDVSNEIRVEP